MRKYAVWMSDSDALTRVYPAQTRAQIAALGWTVTDTAQGPQLSKK